jgi:hypothetical protein
MKRLTKRTAKKIIPQNNRALSWYRGMVGVAIGLMALVFCFQGTTISAPLPDNSLFATKNQNIIMCQQINRCVILRKRS